MTDARRVQLIVHLAAGSLLALLAILVDYLPDGAPGWGLMQVLCFSAGLILIVAGFLPNLKVVSRVSTAICLSILSGVILLLLCEVFFRAVGFDFAREEQAWRRIPPFFRAPNVPTGQVFFRRRGPEQWTGQVLNTFLRQLNVQPNPYGDEREVTVSYNKNGFRNPDDLSDWDVVVAGDSFVELSYLPDDEIYTTLLGKTLNLQVLNLGVSQTGPLSQLSFLQDYGVSARTRQVVVVFFEGNDLKDLASEYQAVRRWKETGQREYRDFKKQSSLLKAMPRLLAGFKRVMKPYNPVTAYFKSATGEVPVTLSETQQTGFDRQTKACGSSTIF